MFQTMTNWYYFDANERKQGPINNQQLKALATQGIITPDTLLETETGQKGKAGQIRGLFQTSSPQNIPPLPVADEKQTSHWITIAGAVVLLLVIGIGIAVNASFSVAEKAKREQRETEARVAERAERDRQEAETQAIAEKEERERQEAEAKAVAEKEEQERQEAEAKAVVEKAARERQEAAAEKARQERQVQDAAIRAKFTAAEQEEIDKFCNKYGHDPKALQNNETLLHKAMADDSCGITVAKYLVAHGVNVNAQSYYECKTPLHVAVEAYAKSLLSAVELYEKGLRPDYAKNARYPEVEKIVWLIRNGADVEARDYYRDTPKNSIKLITLSQRGANFLAGDGLFSPGWAAHDDLTAIINAARSSSSSKEIEKKALARQENFSKNFLYAEWKIANKPDISSPSYANDRVGGSASGLMSERGKPSYEHSTTFSDGSTRGIIMYGDKTYGTKDGKIDSISTSTRK